MSLRHAAAAARNGRSQQTAYGALRTSAEVTFAASRAMGNLDRAYSHQNDPIFAETYPMFLADRDASARMAMRIPLRECRARGFGTDVFIHYVDPSEGKQDESWIKPHIENQSIKPRYVFSVFRRADRSVSHTYHVPVDTPMPTIVDSLVAFVANEEPTMRAARAALYRQLQEESHVWGTEKFPL